MPEDFASYAASLLNDGGGQADAPTDTASNDNVVASQQVSSEQSLTANEPVSTPDLTQAQQATPPAVTLDEDTFAKIDPNTLSPELLAQYKNMQADYTRSKQAIAEQRKAYEGLSEEAVSYAKQLEFLRTQDPAFVAAWLEQQATQLRGVQQAQPVDDDPYGDIQTDNPDTLFLLDELRSLRAQQAEANRYVEQTRLREELAQVDREFVGVEQAFGVTLTQTERRQVAAFCAQNGIRDVATGYKALHFDTLLQKARDEAQSVVQQKAAGAPVHTPVENREAPVQRAEPNDFRGMVEARLRNAGF